MVKKFAVLGNPIAHSLSPVIHSQFAKQFGHSIDYQKTRVEIPQFNDVVRQFFADGGAGLNVTVPFKVAAFELAGSRTARAELAGAVNTLWLSDGVLLADNTDGAGLVVDITQNLGWPLAGKRVLLLGAGGAVRGVLAPILAQCPVSLVIANRTVSKAEALCAAVADVATETSLKASGYADVQGQFDVIVNGTSSSIDGVVPPVPLTVFAAASCYDMYYSAQPTVFLAAAQQHGAAACADGLGMLVGQAAESYRLWTGSAPDTATVLRFMRDYLYG